MTPILALALVSPQIVASNSFDLTALTGGPIGGQFLGGFNESDFFFQGSFATKREGGVQLVQEWFGSPLPTGGAGAYVHLTVSDGINVSNGGDNDLTNDNRGTSLNFGPTQIDCGVRFHPRAMRALKKATFATFTGSGTYVVTASLSDSSHAPVTLTLPTGDASFTAQWRTPTAGQTCTIEIRRTVAAGSDHFLIPHSGWIAVPARIVQAKVGKRIAHWHGNFGGTN